MNLNVGFIGAGNMGYAMIKYILESKNGFIDKINVFDTDTSKLESLTKNNRITIKPNNTSVIWDSEVIILAVKPNVVRDVLETCKDAFDDTKIFVSIAVGIPIIFYKEILGKDKKVIRVMPNTPALVGEGMTLITHEENIPKKDLENIKKIFELFSKVEFIDEKHMNAATALTSSSPAYVYMFIEAMADAAVLMGIPRSLAYKLGSQAVLGSAKMVLETNLHPGVLKDQVCSPEGTTIEAVRCLEKNGLRFALIEAMQECAKKAKLIGDGFIDKISNI